VTVRACAAVLALLCTLACGEQPRAPARGERKAASASVAAPQIDHAAERKACLERIAEARRALEPPFFKADIERAELLARAKGEPVVFVRRPEPARDESPEIEFWRKRIFASKSPAYSLYMQYGSLRRRPDIARALLLSDGYLYSESPGVGAALFAMVELHHLFAVPELIIQRGATEQRAVRRGEQYVYASGPDEGKPARLLLFDRVFSPEQRLERPLHRDLRSLQQELGFDRVRIQGMNEDSAVAELRYGKHWVPALLTAKGARFELGCQAIAGDVAEDIELARGLAQRQRRVHAALRRAIEMMVDEALPFDEPRTEEGQQDGNLRPKWRFAYLQGWERYEFNDDHYYVFDAAGRPRVPQVCVDFIMDAFERTSGTWWRPRGQARERVLGALDFDAVSIDNRRSVERFVDYAEQHPEWFDVAHLPWEERVPFQRRSEFFEHLYSNADRYLPGDVVTIHGLRDDDEYHYHSFIVLESDPLTGMPMLVAANSGQPRIRPLANEMLSAPKRSLKTRVRPRLEWLESIVPERQLAREQLARPNARAGQGTES
jgi:hypothetical protein